MFLQALFEGLINGAILALVAMGIALVWGVMNILSFSQGEFLMIGMFLSYYLNKFFKMDPLFALPICAGVMFMFGYMIYKTIIVKALKGPVLSQRLITFALSMVLINLTLLLLGGEFKTIRKVAFKGTIDLGWLMVSKQKLVPFVVAMIIAGCMFYFLGNTRTGKAIKATAMDKEAAALVGIDTERSYALAFSLASAIAGAAGCALTYFYYIFPGVGANFQLFGFIVVSMGGFGSITGAFLGGLIMGIVDTFTGVYLSTAFKYLGVCVAFIVVVSFRPKGIFGR
jgi:branched-chain amino acid transport system permease protein